MSDAKRRQSRPSVGTQTLSILTAGRLNPQKKRLTFGWVSRFSDCLLFSGVSLVFAPDGSGGKDEEVCGRFSGAVRKSNGKRERILLSAVIVRYNSENGASASVQSPFSEGGAVVRSARASIFSSSALYLPFISSQRAIRLSQTSFSICFPM